MEGPSGEPEGGKEAQGTSHPFMGATQVVGKRFFGYFLVATRKYLGLGSENPIQTSPSPKATLLTHVT